MIPEQLGPYRIERKIGRGGMGTVYYGVHCDTGDEAAVKVLTDSLSADEGFLARFAAEVETLKRLEHPNIVRLYGYGEQGEHTFYAMEFVEGRNLQDELSAGRRFQWREVTRIAIDVCRALKHAHDSGVVHRDLKPANLMFGNDERIKLTDFGIARLFGHSHLTTTGGVMGTADFMSPEQAEGQRVDVRSDLYSLGCVMYALLAGKPPFTADSLAKVLDKLRFADPIPVGQRAEDVPQELERIIGQLLEKEPKERIPTAVALTKRLEAMLHALSVRPDLDDLPRDGDADTDEHEFVVRDPDSGTDKHDEDLPSIATRETISVPEKSSEADRRAREDTQDAPSSAKAEAPEEEPSPAEQPQRTDKAGHFTSIEEERTQLRDTQVAARYHPVFWLKVGGLLALLGLAAWAIIAPLRPRSDSQLYEQIADAAQNETAESLLSVNDQIEEFLERFPDHPKADEVRAWRQDVQLHRLESKFERLARGQGDHRKITSVERVYLEAIQLADTQPVLAVTKLESLVDVYDSSPDLDERSRLCMDLALSQIERLRRDADAWTDEHLQLILAQLDRADALDPSDAATAQAVRRGVVQLYAARPWAAAAVERARQSLSNSESPTE
jgi:serine/threonine protein kinase